MVNPHFSIFPRLIDLYNKHPRYYYQYLGEWMTRGEARQIKLILIKWIEETNYPVYLNEY